MRSIEDSLSEENIREIETISELPEGYSSDKRVPESSGRSKVEKLAVSSAGGNT